MEESLFPSLESLQIESIGESLKLKKMKEESLNKYTEVHTGWHIYTDMP